MTPTANPASITPPVTTSKTVVLVGHCGPDSSFLRMAVRSAAPAKEVDVRVGMADDDQTLNRLLESPTPPDLLLLNRVMEAGFATSSGVDMVRALKTSHPSIPTMLVSNYPDAQSAAEAAGALPGFGKSEIGTDKAKRRLREALGV